MQSKVSCHLFPAPGPLGKSYRLTQNWCLPLLNLELPGSSYALNRGWLPLVPASTEHAKIRCCLFGVCGLLRDLGEVKAQAKVNCL